MSAAAQFLRGIDLAMTLLCLVNLALVIDSLATHHLPSNVPPSAASAYLSCLIYCLFQLVTLLLIITVRALPQLCHAAGNDTLAATGCAIQLGVQLFLLLPRTLIVLSLLSTVLRSRVLLLGDAAHTVFYLSSTLLLFTYSCAILVLDCQRVQRWTADTMAGARPVRSMDEVRILGMSVFGGPLWMTEHDASARTRGLSEAEIERVTTLTTFTPAAPIADKREDGGVEEQKVIEVETEARVAVQPTPEQQQRHLAIELQQRQQEATIDSLHYDNLPPAQPPSPVPPEPAQQSVNTHTTQTLPPHSSLALCLLTAAPQLSSFLCLCSVSRLFGGVTSW